MADFWVGVHQVEGQLRYRLGMCSHNLVSPWWSQHLVDSSPSQTDLSLQGYYIVPNATWQWFKMCVSVCLSPHNLQWLDKPWLRLRIARLALCGRVSWAAFKANLRAFGGNFCTVSDHRVAASFPSVDAVPLGEVGFRNAQGILQSLLIPLFS